MKGRVILVMFICLLLMVIRSSADESITLTTYFPAPSGEYEVVKVRKLAVGPSLDPGTLSDGQLEVEDDVMARVDFTVGRNLRVNGTGWIEGDVRMNSGVVVGNPTGGNMGAGTINVQEGVYVNGTEISTGGFSECEIVEKKCYAHSHLDYTLSCEVCCPSDEWLISGGGVSSPLRGSIFQSYPKSAGKGGTWYIMGGVIKDCVTVYALCCK